MDSDSDTQKELKAYLEQHQIHELFTKIVEELLKKRPENPLQSIAEYMYQHHGVSAGGDAKDGGSEEKEVIESYVEDDEDEDDDDDDDYADEEEEDVGNLVAMRKPPTNSRRVSVSAGVLDMKSLQNTAAPVFEKSDEEKANIMDCLKNNALFNQCDPDALDTIVGAMESCSFGEGDVIIQEGDMVAEHFFILKSGTAEAYKGETSVKKYEPKEGFGELALLYNQPRAATVKASSDATCWRLDQNTFKKIIVVGVIQKREKYITFLKKCALMKELNEFEMMTLADSLEQRTFKKGDKIITQGEPGNEFFVLEEGQVQAEKDGVAVKDIIAGDYFGEIALLYNKPRQASVVVTSDSASVLAIDRKTFQRVIGVLGEILKRDPLHQQYI